MRFITDYFEDYYFEWDSKKYKSRKEHNLVRAKKYLSFYKNVCSKKNELKKIVGKIKRYG
jgi:hypothetical protein